ncbi:MAG: class I SAM-dependent methyltransferase [Corallococcus sp.]|nr:class I SAM-dependent methyltransferase [Corallococcus sp.]
MSTIFHTVTAKQNVAVLDIGFGTGTLTAKLYESGCEIWGQDFSQKMIDSATSKMPNARLFQGDFSQGLAEPLSRKSYDFVIATYSLHHLDADNQIKSIQSLLGLLKQDGKLLIGDIAFFDMQDLEQCRKSAGEEWDDEENYFVYSELKKYFPNMKFEKVSHCAGVLSLLR